MPEVDADIAELQRRAYGPDDDDLSTIERARLAQFEASSRIPVAQPGTSASRLPVQSYSESEHAGHEDSSSGPAPKHPCESAPAYNSGRLRPVSSPPVRLGERHQNGEVAAWHGRKWFTPALSAAIGVGAVIVMVVAGGIGWGGGYVAGFTRHAGPGGGANFITELHPTEMPERYTEAAAGFEGSPESPGMLDGRTYFGSLGDGIEVFTIQLSTTEGSDHGPPSDAVCLAVSQTVELSANNFSFGGDSACGVSQLGVTVDLFAGVDDEEDPTGLHLRTDAYPQNTLLRFTYVAVTDVVTVWSLPPSK